MTSTFAADDLSLNVSRETLQQGKFLKQIKQIIVKRLLQLLTKIAEEDPEKFSKIYDVYGTVIKLGAVESTANREKLTSLARFSSTQRDKITLDEVRLLEPEHHCGFVFDILKYLENRKEGQKQIFYLADVGKAIDSLKKSVFVEKLAARVRLPSVILTALLKFSSKGYEVLLLNEPLDDVLFTNLRRWKKVPFQDVAKAGLKFGDEGITMCFLRKNCSLNFLFSFFFQDLDPEEEKEQLNDIKERFKPLIMWLKGQASEVVRDGKSSFIYVSTHA